MSQFLVVLRGAPASGKTTISKKLRNFEKRIAWLKVDNFKDFFSDDSSEALEYVNGSATATLKYLLDQGFSIVMDGVFQDTKEIDEVVNYAKGTGIKNIVYQIQCPLEVLKERDRNREGVREGFRKPLGDDVITKIYETLESNIYPNCLPLDTEHLTIDECVDKIQYDVSN